MKNKAMKILLAAAGTTAVLAGVTVALWVSGDQPKEGMSSYTAPEPLHPEELYVDRVVSDPSKPQPAGQYANRNQAPQQTSDAALTLEGMTDDEIEAFIAQAALETPEDAEVNTLYWETFKVFRKYEPNKFHVDHMWDENKNDVIEAAVELYNGGRLPEADKKTIGLFVYDQISSLAGAGSPYYEAADRIVKEIRTQPWFVPDETPAS